MNGKDIEKRLKSMELFMRRAPKGHQVQPKVVNLIERNPANVKVSDISNRYLNVYHDKDTDTKGIILNINGSLIKIEGTAL